MSEVPQAQKILAQICGNAQRHALTTSLVFFLSSSMKLILHCLMSLFIILRMTNSPLDCKSDANFQIPPLHSQKHQDNHVIIQCFNRLFKKRMAASFRLVQFCHKWISRRPPYSTLNVLSNRTNFAPSPRGPR